VLDRHLKKAAKRAGLRPIVVDDLGRDALVIAAHGLVLIDAGAEATRGKLVARRIRALTR
jgi:DNA-binding response OmpR family regulator